MKSVFCGALALSAGLVASAGLAQENPTRPCKITDGKDLEETALCSFLDVGEIVEYKGRIDENDVTFTVVVNRREKTAQLVGADTFVLADGPAVIDKSGIAWANGYALSLVH